jgi:phosphonate transport system substrate-binding protein
MLAACLVMHCLGASFGESVRLAVTDIVGLEELQREFGACRGLLSEATGFDVEFFPVSNRTAAVC